MANPRTRKGMPDTTLSEAEFRRRFLEQFQDPAFRAVQAELLLDAVKPVRNDLCDSDLEVVAPCARSGDAATTEKSPTRDTGSESAADRPELRDEPAWARVKEQVFGVGKP